MFSYAAVRVLVAGAAISGAAAAIALARRGHDVVLLERDAQSAPAEPADAFAGWNRPGVAHFRLPHAFLALGTRLLRTSFPEILDDLRTAGALKIDLTAGAPAGVVANEDLTALGCRRPVIEWSLRRALERARGIQIVYGSRIEELIGEGDPPRITGVRTHEGETIAADFVVDATGRSSRLARWLTALGARPVIEETEPCGLVYYCRYYRLAEGQSLPTTISPLGPRADLGHMSFGTFPGDNGTWALALNCPAWVREFHALRGEGIFDAVTRSIPALASLVAPDVSSAITEVLPMGELRNVCRSIIGDDGPVVLGVQPIGDALANTNPTFAWGLSLALSNALEIAATVDEHGADLHALALAFDASAGEQARTCYRWSRDTDLSRKGLWSGEPRDASSPDADLPLFITSTIGAAGRRDAEIYERSTRRAQLLDPLDELPSDRPLLDRAAAIVAEMRKLHPPRPQGPSRDEMLALLRGEPRGN